MGIFSDWSLDDLRRDFSKYMASGSFKELCEEYFTSLIQEEKKNSKLRRAAEWERLYSEGIAKKFISHGIRYPSYIRK